MSLQCRTDCSKSKRATTHAVQCKDEQLRAFCDGSRHRAEIKCAGTKGVFHAVFGGLGCAGILAGGAVGFIPGAIVGTVRGAAVGTAGGVAVGIRAANKAKRN